MPLPVFMSHENIGRIMAAAKGHELDHGTTIREEAVMYVIREAFNCKPGKVRQMLEKFRSISTVMKDMGGRTASPAHGRHGRTVLDHRR